MSITTLRRTVGAAPLLDEDAGDRRIWFRLCTLAIDRHGTIILPDGVDVSTHSTNPVFLWMHQSSSRGSALKVGDGPDSFAVSLASAPQPPPDVVIGQVDKYRQTPEYLDIRVLFDTDEMADLCYQKVRRGFLRAVSIGCNVIEETTRDVDGVKVPVYVRSELLEASLVIIPSNREALQLDRGAATMALRAIEAPVDVDDAPPALATSIAGDAAADALLRAAAAEVAPVEARADEAPPAEVARADGDAPLPADAEPLAPGEARDAVPAPMAGDNPPDGDADDRAAAQQGVYVCLFPIAGTVDALAVVGGKAAGDLHCTLAHVPPEGLPDGWEDRLTMILRRTADRYPILRGAVSGIGRLATGDGDVVVALPDMPRLAEVAAVVRDEMYWADFRPSRDHGWLPHITLAKIASDADLPLQRLDALPLVFDALSFVAGGVRHNFNFATPDSVSAGDANDLPSGARTLRAALADCEATAALLRTEIERTEAAENAPIDRRDADPYLARDVQTAGDASAAAVLTAQVEDPKERTMPISMSPECRWAMRASIAHAMDGAELHSAMADIAPEGHRSAHRDFAMGSLKRAEDLHKLYRAGFTTDEDEGGAERKAPDLKDTELKARFAEVAALCGKLPRTAAQVLRQYAGTDKPDDAEVELMALRADRADLVKTRTAARTEQKRTEGEQRDALIAKYMEPGVALITPADAKTMRGIDPATDAVVGEPWSPNRIEVFAQKRMASGGGPAADLVRTAPLANAGGSAATATPGATPLQPGNTPAAVDTPAAPSMVRVMSGRGKDVTHLAASAIANVPGLSEEDLRRSMAALTSTGVQSFAPDAQKIAVK